MASRFISAASLVAEAPPKAAAPNAATSLLASAASGGVAAGEEGHADFAVGAFLDSPDVQAAISGLGPDGVEQLVRTLMGQGASGIITSGGEGGGGDGNT